MRLKTLEFNEALNKPYPYKWKYNTAGKGYASFETGTSTIVVEIEQFFKGTGDIEYYHTGDDPIDVHEITFHDAAESNKRSSKFKLTGKGAAFRVMATIIAVITEYVMKHKSNIDALGFIASGRGRSRLYERIFNKLTPPGKWIKEKYSLGGNSADIFIMIKD